MGDQDMEETLTLLWKVQYLLRGDGGILWKQQGELSSACIKHLSQARLEV